MGLNTFRDKARNIATELGMDAEFYYSAIARDAVARCSSETYYKLLDIYKGREQ